MTMRFHVAPVLIVIFNLQLSCGQPSPPSHPASLVTNDVAPPLFFAALFGLPETRTFFLNTVGNHAWETELPENVAALLSSQERSSLEESFNTWIEELPAVQQDAFLRRLDRWMAASEQIQLCSRLSSVEETIDAIVSLPSTRDPAISALPETRELDQEEPGAIGGSLSSAEMAGVTYSTLEYLSTLDDQLLLQYFSDLYQALSE